MPLPVSKRGSYWRLWRAKWQTLPLFALRGKQQIYIALNTILADTTILSGAQWVKLKKKQNKEYCVNLLTV